MRLQRSLRPQTTSEIGAIIGALVVISALMWLVFKPGVLIEQKLPVPTENKN